MSPTCAVATLLHINLLGSFHLSYKDEPVTSLNTEKQALGNLRNLLFRLRRALPEADRFVRSVLHCTGLV